MLCLQLSATVLIFSSHLSNDPLGLVPGIMFCHVCYHPALSLNLRCHLSVLHPVCVSGRCSWICQPPGVYAAKSLHQNMSLALTVRFIYEIQTCSRTLLCYSALKIRKGEISQHLQRKCDMVTGGGIVANHEVGQQSKINCTEYRVLTPINQQPHLASKQTTAQN